MKIEKLTAGLLSLLLMGTVAMPVRAANNDSQSMDLTASVESTFMLTIPAKTEIGYSNTSTNLNGTLKVTGNVLSTQKVTVTADAKSLHNTVQDTDLPYMLMNGTEVFTSADWSEAELSAAAPKELQLRVVITEADWNAAKAGNYTGSIVFTAKLDTKQP